MPAQVGVSFFSKCMPHHLWRIKFHLIVCALLIRWTTYVGTISEGKSPMQDLGFTEIRDPQGTSEGCSEFFQNAWKNLGTFGNFYSAQEDYKKVEYFFVSLPSKIWAPWKLLMLKSFGRFGNFMMPDIFGHRIIRFKRFSIYAQTFWA